MQEDMTLPYLTKVSRETFLVYDASYDVNCLVNCLAVVWNVHCIIDYSKYI